MPRQNSDLHGNVPEASAVALLLIDVINDLEWPGGDEFLPQALQAAEKIAALKPRCAEAGIPAIYVNDNFGRWQSDFQKLVSHSSDAKSRGHAIARLLKPNVERDFFVLKPKHSGFFSTTLDTLLEYLGASTLILTGFTADSCVLFTASDAYMRDFKLVVPSDCVASIDNRANAHALEHMKRVLKAEVLPSTELDLHAIKARSRNAE